MCNPWTTPRASTAHPPRKPSSGDPRSAAQRNHDGLVAALRGVLASGELGQHNGLPASIVVTTTLQELEAAAGRGLTGGGTILPMSDVIRLARHAHHYLAIFDKGKALALYHTKRLASPGQRIVLYAKDRGCSSPGLHRARLLLRSPSRHRLQQVPHHRRQRPDLRLRPPPSPATSRRLDDPQKRQRRHRMDPAAAPGPWPTPDDTFHHPESFCTTETTIPSRETARRPRWSWSPARRPSPGRSTPARSDRPCRQCRWPPRAS